MGRSATDQDVELAIELLAETAMPIGRIAKKLGCNVFSLSARCSEHKFIERAREARVIAAQERAAQAEDALMAISDDAQAGERARQLALADLHKWQASYLDRRTFGKESSVDNSQSIQVVINTLLPNQPVTIDVSNKPAEIGKEISIGGGGVLPEVGEGHGSLAWDSDHTQFSSNKQFSPSSMLSSDEGDS